MTALCVPQRGEKGLLTPQQRKPGHCSAYAEWSSFTLTLPHTYTHMHAHTAGQRKKDGRGRGQCSGKAVPEEFLICSSKAENKIKSHIVPGLAGGTWASTCAACLVVKLGNKPTVLFCFLTATKAQPLKLLSCRLELCAQNLIYMHRVKKKDILHSLQKQALDK